MTVKRITQDTFDSAVKENMETFEMDEEEAIQSAVEEFEMQGVDLKGIIKSKGGGNMDGHPASAALVALAAVGKELEAKEGDEELAKAALSCLADLDKALGDVPKDALSDLLVVLGQGVGGSTQLGAVEYLCGTARAAGPDVPLLMAAITQLHAFVKEDPNKTRFRRAAGPMLMKMIATDHRSNAAVLELVAELGATTTWKHEDNKIDFMTAGMEKVYYQALIDHRNEKGALYAVCNAMNGLARADDERAAASQAFQNARAMAKLGSHEALVEALKVHKDEDHALAGALCATLKRVAVNEDICKKVADLGGVPLMIQVLAAGGVSHVGLARSGCQVLRQLAGSDACKALIVEHGGLPVANGIVAAHRNNSQVLEQSIGIIAACCLRAPELAEKAFAAACVESTMDVILENPGYQWAWRAWCLMVRNMVSRSPDLRPALLEKGVEATLRAAKVGPARNQCTDVASAALRDLGFDDYNAEGNLYNDDDA